MLIREFLYTGMIKDGGTNPSKTCKIAAQQLAADSDIVGVVGAMRSSCSQASHQYFRDNGERNNVMEHKIFRRHSCLMKSWCYSWVLLKPFFSRC